MSEQVSWRPGGVAQPTDKTISLLRERLNDVTKKSQQRRVELRRVHKACEAKSREIERARATERHWRDKFFDASEKVQEFEQSTRHFAASIISAWGWGFTFGIAIGAVGAWALTK